LLTCLATLPILPAFVLEALVNHSSLKNRVLPALLLRTPLHILLRIPRTLLLPLLRLLPHTRQLLRTLLRPLPPAALVVVAAVGAPTQQPAWEPVEEKAGTPAWEALVRVQLAWWEVMVEQHRRCNSSRCSWKTNKV